MKQLTPNEIMEADIQSLIYKIHYLMSCIGGIQKYTPKESYELMTRALVIKKDIVELQDTFENIEKEHNNETDGH